jgi:Flp pilus assembly protein TadG
VRISRNGRQLSASSPDGEQPLPQAPPLPQADRRRRRQLGQVLPIFAIMTVVMLGGAALLTDVAWWWTNEQRMQRAADAGALAGAIYLPGNEALAFNAAVAEATKNGYTGGTDGVVVTPRRDHGDPRKLLVDIDGPVGTHFAKVFCWDGGPCLQSVAVGVTGSASYVLPVPMGSPENHYGVFGKLRTPGGGTTIVSDADTGWIALATTKGPTTWQNAGDVYLSDNQRASTSVNDRRQQWGLVSNVPFPADLSSIRGIEVNVEARTTGGSNCRLGTQLSWNDGNSWTSGSSGNQAVPSSGGLTTSDPASPYYGMGGAGDRWGRSSWSQSDFSANRFRIRLTNLSPASCSGATQVDYILFKVHYRASTLVPDANIADPYDQALAPRGFWGTFINQGADKINGDAYLPKWDPRTSGANLEYDPDSYYNYAVEFPAGSSNGELWVYDPVFCATSGNGSYGTGDRWFGSSTNPTSAYYTLYDTKNTPYVFGDDTEVATSGSLFANIRASDESLNGPNLGPSGAQTDCSVGATTNQSNGRYWHNRWWLLKNGLQGDTTYRLHTRSTDPGNPSAMNNANGHNSFALWSKATGGSPKIHGLSAMEAFTPLNGGGDATFYLAQIDKEHAGKTMVIRLWDPGDTGSLPAALKILKPTSSVYAETSFSYTAERVANGASSCANRSGVNVASVTTNTGGTKLYNGCWLTIEIPLPANYTAPHPSSDTVTPEGGWWKIRYSMGGSTSDAAFDLTTWQVELRGNPVHLVLE